MLWLWYRPAVVAPIPPLDGELPYGAGAAIKKKKEKKGREKKRSDECTASSEGFVLAEEADTMHTATFFEVMT